HFLFFFNATATTEIYTLSLHDALPIWSTRGSRSVSLRVLEHDVIDRRGEQERIDAIEDAAVARNQRRAVLDAGAALQHRFEEVRSEEHTSELQSRGHLVCRLLLEKKKK